MDYVSFSDESGIGKRFTSIAAFSFSCDATNRINCTLANILNESNVSEFKWNKLRGAKYRFCAIKLINAVLEFIGTTDARIDILSWDHQDARHAVQGRDDTANFARMYFHLHLKILKKRPRNSFWRLYPDEKVEIDWANVRKCLSAIGQRQEPARAMIPMSFFNERHYSISDFRQVHSHDEPCCQVADLFAGMALFSREHYDDYVLWARQAGNNLCLWPEERRLFNKRFEDRFIVLAEFNKGCKAMKLGVSLNSQRRLHTFRPSNPINFWHYERQHQMDIAPLLTRD